MSKSRQNGSHKSSRGRGERDKPRGQGYKQRKGAPRQDVAAVAAATGLPEESLAIVQCELGYPPGAWKEVQKALAHYAADKVNAPAEVQGALVERVLPTIAPEPVTATIDVDAR